MLVRRIGRGQSLLIESVSLDDIFRGEECQRTYREGGPWRSGLPKG
jgi:hypothetical protein